MVITSKELFVNGELALSRKEAHGKSKQNNIIPVFTSRMGKNQYYKRINPLDIRNALDVKGILQDIRENWHTYVSKIHHWIQTNPVKKLIVTGIFTIVLGFVSGTADAAFINEYTYQVKNGDNIEKIAAEHGVTAQEILDANGISSINGKKILLPTVQNRTVTATVLNVRSQPNTSSVIIGKLKKDETVKVAFVENGWAGILIKGRVCFVSVDYLKTPEAVSTISKPASIADTSQSKTLYVTATSLRVREEASTNSAILGSLKFNDNVSVISTSNGWSQIVFNGKTAFVSNTYLTDKEPVGREKVMSGYSAEYIIKKGDTFTKISKLLNITVSSIQELNPKVDSSRLKIGQTIQIPATTAATNQIKVTAQIGGVDPEGTFRFITPNGRTYSAKATGNIINELFSLEGKKVTMTLDAKRGQEINLISLEK